MRNTDETMFGTYLKGCRARLDPAAFGLPSERRRTPGLRREEVAQRANVSATWYTWLEQGRGGSPSADVLDRLSGALLLTAAEREHLFLLAQHRPPKVEYQPCEQVTPQLQRVLDALPFSPAIVKTAAWQIVGWNRAAKAVLADYAAMPFERRNVLRMLFCDRSVRSAMVNWADYARFAVAVFRSEAARAGASRSIEALVDELIEVSPDFAAIWRDHDVRRHGEGVKRIDRPGAGVIELGYASFAVDGRPDLSLVVHTPATPIDQERVAAIVEAASEPGSSSFRGG